MKKRSTVGLAVCAVAAIGFIGYRFFFHVAFNESLYVRPYTIDFFLAINSKTIRHFPSIDVVGERSFHSDCGDGPKQPSNSVSYSTQASTQEVWKVVNAFVEKRGYVRGDDLNTVYGGKVFLKGDKHFEVSIGENDGLTYVRACEIN